MSSLAIAHANLLKPKPEYTWRQGLSDMVAMIEMIQDPKLRAQAKKVAAFHGYLSPGALVGIRMFRIARQVLDLSEDERILLDPAKTLRYPMPHAWFMKSCKVSHTERDAEILCKACLEPSVPKEPPPKQEPVI